VAFVLSHENQVKLVFINSFNEYHERSEVEPHYDFTDSTVSPTYLLNLTALYTQELNS
jgi:two-component SAPR family response regulator